MADKTLSPNLVLKGVAVFWLWLFLGHPSMYVTIWERKAWYPMIIGTVVVPILLVWAIQVLVWRIRLGPSTIEIRSLRGVLKKQIADISRLERTPGRICVTFNDGNQRTIPAIVGDLDAVQAEIASRRAL
jgi:hypothetical protein